MASFLMTELVFCCPENVQLSGAAEFPDVIPTRWFCEASPDEVRTALLETTRKELSFKEFNDVMLRIDSTIRDASFDPFKVGQGAARGLDRVVLHAAC